MISIIAAHSAAVPERQIPREGRLLFQELGQDGRGLLRERQAGQEAAQVTLPHAST